MTNKEIAEENEIIRCVVGSTVHGLALEGTDDLDEMGVFIEPPRYVCGIDQIVDDEGRAVEQWVYRTQPEGVRSGPGDIDRTVYSLRKYIRLAAKGNPSILLLLFVPAQHTIYQSSWGVTLRELTPAIVSKQAGDRFLGYMQAQRKRVLGIRGQARLSNRPELIERFGWDVKYGSHMIRLALQGIELMETGKISLPMPIEERYAIRGIREGKLSKEATLEWAEELERQLRTIIGISSLPLYPDYNKINTTLTNMHQSYWRASGYV